MWLSESTPPSSASRYKKWAERLMTGKEVVVVLPDRVLEVSWVDHPDIVKVSDGICCSTFRLISVTDVKRYVDFVVNQAERPRRLRTQSDSRLVIKREFSESDQLRREILTVFRPACNKCIGIYLKCAHV